MYSYKRHRPTYVTLTSDELIYDTGQISATTGLFRLQDSFHDSSRLCQHAPDGLLLNQGVCRKSAAVLLIKNLDTGVVYNFRIRCRIKNSKNKWIRALDYGFSSTAEVVLLVY